MASKGEGLREGPIPVAVEAKLVFPKVVFYKVNGFIEGEVSQLEFGGGKVGFGTEAAEGKVEGAERFLGTGDAPPDGGKGGLFLGVDPGEGFLFGFFKCFPAEVGKGGDLSKVGPNLEDESFFMEMVFVKVDHHVMQKRRV